MIRQASEEFDGNKGLSQAQMAAYARDGPVGHAIELRIYAENPARDFAPSPGLLQNVDFPTIAGVRVDTWIETGVIVSPSFGMFLNLLIEMIC